jgi:hypothetical protein
MPLTGLNHKQIRQIIKNEDLMNCNSHSTCKELFKLMIHLKLIQTSSLKKNKNNLNKDVKSNLDLNSFNDHLYASNNKNKIETNIHYLNDKSNENHKIRQPLKWG